jgi:hypothetical protein
MQPAQFLKTGPIKIYWKIKWTKLIFILTAELYTVNLNGSKKLFKSADMYAGENFSPDGNYLMISTIQNHFPVPLNRFPTKQSFMIRG